MLTLGELTLSAADVRLDHASAQILAFVACRLEAESVELHARTLAMAAVGFGIPVVLSTVAYRGATS